MTVLCIHIECIIIDIIKVKVTLMSITPSKYPVKSQRNTVKQKTNMLLKQDRIKKCDSNHIFEKSNVI